MLEMVQIDVEDENGVMIGTGAPCFYCNRTPEQFEADVGVGAHGTKQSWNGLDVIFSEAVR